MRLRPRTLLGLAAAAVSVAALACTEDPLPLGPDTAPGASTETIDLTIDVADLPGWRDTTVSGFATPTNASFSYVVNTAALAARTLVLFDVPDTINTFADTLPVDEFDGVNVRLQIDTVRSEFSGFPLTFRLVALDRPFEGDAVDWTRAAEGVPWTTPGGDLGVQLASGILEAKLDTLPLAMDVPGDSLLKAWQAADGGNGFAVLVEGPGASVRLQQVLLRYDALLVGRTELVSRSQTPDVRTFIVDPPSPATGVELRIGGLPASRPYIDFRVPATLQGVPLTGSTVNHAELIFHPLPAPADPYALDQTLVTRQISLLGDPFVLGAKTPIGTPTLQGLGLLPDSLAAGRPLRIDISALVARSAMDPDRAVRLGLRGEPDAQGLGYWEFGSAEAADGFRPEFRIILSPSAQFTVP